MLRFPILQAVLWGGANVKLYCWRQDLWSQEAAEPLATAQAPADAAVGPIGVVEIWEMKLQWIEINTILKSKYREVIKLGSLREDDLCL